MRSAHGLPRAAARRRPAPDVQHQGGGRIADTSMTVMVILESEDYLRAWRGSRNNVGLAIVVLVAAMTIASFFLFGQSSASCAFFTS